MAECKDCIHYDMCKYRPLAIGVDICDVFRNTADVVPKSEEDNSCDSCACKLLDERDDARREVDRLQAEKDALIKNYSECMKDYAREIFEEIERFLYLHFRFCKEEIGNDDTECVKGRMELNTQIQNFIAELKKKYAEEKDD